METILEKEKMDSIRALAETNIKVSEARVTLSNLKESESKYLIEREKKAIFVIDKAIKDSVVILAEAKNNYEQVITLYLTVKEFSSFLVKEYESFKKLLEDFNERSKEWETMTAKRQTAMDEIKIHVAADRIRIKNDIEGIERDRKKLDIDRVKLNDDRGVVERAIERLKLNRI